jgi:hypothetical protein
MYQSKSKYAYNSEKRETMDEDPNLPKPTLIVVQHIPGDHDIWDEDVVRPKNCKWCKQGGEETNSWLLKSRPRCLIYGSCDFCFSSGPIGKHCTKCNKGGIYLDVLYSGHVMDSLTLAQEMEREHEAAKANLTYQWIRTPTKNLHLNLARISMEETYHDHNDEHVKRIMNRIYDMWPVCHIHEENKTIA